MVPGRLQFAGEAVYGFVRNTLARDIIGSEHFMKFVPYLFSLFFFILVNNFFGVDPVPPVPDASRASGFVVPLALITLGHLQRRRHLEARLRSATSSTQTCPPASPARS